MTIHVILGKPRSGKTLLASHIARNESLTGKKVIYYSLELQPKTLYEKYGINRAVEVNYSPDMDCKTLIDTIKKNPNSVCIVDYVQLLKDHSSRTLKLIIDEFSPCEELWIKLFLVSLCNRKGEDVLSSGVTQAGAVHVTHLISQERLC